MLKKLIKSKILWLLIILLGSGFVYFNFFSENTSSKNSEEEINTTKPKIMDMKKSIQALGNAELVDEQSLQFNKNGTITKVNFYQGDKVKKGNVIAELDKSQIMNDIEQARKDLETAQIQLEQLYEGPNESNKLSAQKKIEDDKDQLQTLQSELKTIKANKKTNLEKLQNDIDYKKKQIDNKQKTLKNKKQQYQTMMEEQKEDLNSQTSSRQKTINSIRTNIEDRLFEIKDKLNEIDKLLGVTQEYENNNDFFEDYLGAKNDSVKLKAKENFSKARKEYKYINNAFDKKTTDKNKLLNYLEELEKLYEIMSSLNDNIYDTLENSVKTSNFSSSDISSWQSKLDYTSSINSTIKNIQSDIHTLNSMESISLMEESQQNTLSEQNQQIQNLETELENLQDQLQTSKEEYKIAESDRNQKIDNKEKAIKSQQKQLEVDKKSLQELLEGPTQEDIRIKQNSIQQKRLRIEQLKDQISDYELEAPFSGVITQNDYKIGDKLTSDVDKKVYMENPDLLQISVLLDQVDIVEVSEGDRALITFDAYPKEQFEAEINNIVYTPIDSSGVISYEVILIITDTDFDKKVYSGMTADVEIILEEKKNVLTISSADIIENKGSSFVRVLMEKSDKPELVNVKTGLEADGRIEILSGIKKDQKIVTQTLQRKPNSGVSSERGPGMMRGMR